MSSAARRGGRLKDALTLDDLMLSEVEETSSGDSPLQLLSPQELTKKVLGENGELSLENVEYEEKIKANYLVEDEEEIAPLPKFNKRKVDPRRQSTAIFSAFEKTTSGMGLLGDSELAVGDEDMELLIPLAKSSAALAAKGISNLWVDPDMEDAFLEEDLPEPSLEVLEAAAGACAEAPSPQPSPIFSLRDSIAIENGFFDAYRSSPGLDSVKEEELLSPREEETLETTTTMAPIEQITASPPKQSSPDRPKQQPVARKPSRLRPPSSTSSFFSHSSAPGHKQQPSRFMQKRLKEHYFTILFAYRGVIY